MLTQIVFVGMLVGSNVWGFFSDRYGRRPVSESVTLHSVTIVL